MIVNLLALTKKMPEGLPSQMPESVSAASGVPGIALVDSQSFAKTLTLRVQVTRQEGAAKNEAEAPGLALNEVQGKANKPGSGPVKTEQKTRGLDLGIVNEDERLTDLMQAKEAENPLFSVLFQAFTPDYQEEAASPLLMNKASHEDAVLSEESPLKTHNIDTIKQDLPDTVSGLSTNSDRLAQGFGEKKSTEEDSRSDDTKKNHSLGGNISLAKSGLHLEKGSILGEGSVSEDLPLGLSKALPRQFSEDLQTTKNLSAGSVDASGKPSKIEAEQGLPVDPVQIEQIQKPGPSRQALKTEAFAVALMAEAFEAETRTTERPDLHIEAIHMTDHKQEKGIKIAYKNKTNNELSAKVPDAPVLDERIDESLSVQSQEEQEVFEGGQRPSVFSEEVLKVSSLLDGSTREVNTTVQKIEGVALAPSEKAAILSQVMSQFRALRPGKVERLKLQLHPETLGPLQVEIALQKGVLVAHIMTGDPLVKELLEGNQSLLRQSLAEQGFEVDAFSVDVGNTESDFKNREHERPFFNRRPFQQQRSDRNLKDPVFTSKVQRRGRVNLYV